MGESILRSFDPLLEVVSAGTEPSFEVHPKAIKVMKDINIDLVNSYPKSVTKFLNVDFDYVITVCGGAKESCPAFIGKVANRVHMGYEDPSDAVGTDEYVMGEFRRIRDLIKTDFFEFHKNNLKNKS